MTYDGLRPTTHKKRSLRCHILKGILPALAVLCSMDPGFAIDPKNDEVVASYIKLVDAKGENFITRYCEEMVGDCRPEELCTLGVELYERGHLPQAQKLLEKCLDNGCHTKNVYEVLAAVYKWGSGYNGQNSKMYALCSQRAQYYMKNGDDLPTGKLSQQEVTADQVGRDQDLQYIKNFKVQKRDSLMIDHSI